MRKLVFFLILFCPVSPVWACSTAIYPSAVIFETKPTDVPMDSKVIKAQIVEESSVSREVEVLVLEGPRELKDQKIRIRPDVVTSCVTIGRKKGYLAIANKLASQSKQIFVALVFERSWLDHIIGMVGADPYYFPGDRSVGF